ncbi:hypothetical protein [Paenibacillus paeoniae]|uniref:Uncharacterized protein n=1 Tax=Paenibacillus paeoniae TaxID=2292705 RepID=A0A371PL70_9BACL|nr:hypothetical protein [Paenibacillus paeoniae]REK76946.1 hypothetical protein DX130_08020 [Paenibacillus paeoniae]
MSELIRHELSKIAAVKPLYFLIVLFLPVQLYMVYWQHRWRPGSAWEGISALPYSIGTVFEGLIILIALSGVFTMEYSLHTDGLIRSTRLGRTRIVTAKVAAAMIFIVLIVLYIWIVNITSNLMIEGVEGWSEPLHSLNRYSLAPYDLAVWIYILLQLATNLLGCMGFGLLVLALSARTSSILTVFFIAGFLFAIPFLIHNFSEMSLAWLLKHAGFTEIMRVENLFNRPRQVITGNYILPLHPSAFYLYAVLLSALLAWLSYRNYELRRR